jgi:hypothetical protein
MPGNDGRPGEGSRGAANDHRIADEITTDDIPSQLRRRRGASRRLPPLASGLRDPWDVIDGPLSDAEVASWRAAWGHLHALGLPAVVPERVLAAAAGSGVA